MFKVQKESLLLGLFMAILFMFSACETGSRDTQEEELDMIEGADRLPAQDTLMDSLEIETLDSTEISEMRKLRDEGLKYQRLLDSIAEKNPNISYTYIPGDESKIKTVLGDYKVKIDGVQTEEEEMEIAMLLKKKVETRQKMIDFYNRLKHADLAAVPVEGYQEFYNELDVHLDFSKELRAVDAEGLIFVQMAIEKNGKISNPRISENISHLDDAFEEEIEKSSLHAIKEIKMNWIPAQNDGKPVRSQVEIPIWIDADPETQS